MNARKQRAHTHNQLLPTDNTRNNDFILGLFIAFMTLGVGLVLTNKKNKKGEE